MDAWGPADEQPEMLYLDKCWDELQSLFHQEPGSPVRPAHRLVAGQVTMVGWEWEPHIAVLDASEVAAAAADLATVTDDHVATWLRAGDVMHRRASVPELEAPDVVAHGLFSRTTRMPGGSCVRCQSGSAGRACSASAGATVQAPLNRMQAPP